MVVARCGQWRAVWRAGGEAKGNLRAGRQDAERFLFCFLEEAFCFSFRVISWKKLAWTGRGRQVWRARSHLVPSRGLLRPALPSPCLNICFGYTLRPSLVWLHTSSLVFKLLSALIFKVMFDFFSNLSYFFIIYLILKIKT
jgi:hypothetical protein